MKSIYMTDLLSTEYVIISQKNKYEIKN